MFKEGAFRYPLAFYHEVFMLKLTDIDFNAVWQETFGWNTDDKSGRKFDDRVESDFWVKLAPRYTEEYNLNHDTPLIAQRLQQGIKADVEFLHYTKIKSFTDIDAVSQEMCYDLSKKTFLTYREPLLRRFQEQALMQDSAQQISQPRTTVIISVKK
jgi:hypothetical protein